MMKKQQQKNSNQNSKTLVFDIETNGLLLDVNKFWVGWTYCIETKEWINYRDATELVVEINTATCIVGHNIIGYDIPALNRLSNIPINKDIDIVDTLILGRLAYYDKDKTFKHSLDAYGQLLGFPKGSHSDWSKYSKEMDDYCKQDVAVSVKLYQHLKRKTPWLPKEALELEQSVQKIVTQQHINGWMFDVKKAQQLHIELLGSLEEAEAELFSVFTPLPTFVPVKYPKNPYKKDGTKATVLIKQEEKGCKEYDEGWGYFEDVVFNPGSGQHIVRWIEELYGKQKWACTEKGNPKTDATTLFKMFENEAWSKPLLHYFEVKKLLGQLAEGDNAWLKKVADDGRIHGGANILGAVTGRFTHSNPNMAQVPSVRAFKGKESRSLFRVPSNYKLVGCDASGLELRTLSHYLARYDGGAYGTKLLESDIHTANQEAAGLPTRDNAKTFIYGFLYGAGDAKIGEIVKGTSKDGKRLKDTFLKRTEGLNQLVTDVKKAAKRGYLIGLTGRRLFIRSPHSALNTLLQSAGAYVMKHYVVLLDERLSMEGYDYKMVGNIHDEIQIQVHNSQAESVARICEQTFEEVTTKLNFRCKLEGEAKIGDNWADTH
jgi:DNA polymerase I-like protein with 3'-5' exonuclease and polymerase domains